MDSAMETGVIIPLYSLNSPGSFNFPFHFLHTPSKKKGQYENRVPSLGSHFDTTMPLQGKRRLISCELCGCSLIAVSAVASRLHTLLGLSEP